MKVTVFVPIQMEIKGEDKLAEVYEQLYLIDKIIEMSELESDVILLTHLVGDSEIVEDDED